MLSPSLGECISSSASLLTASRATSCKDMNHMTARPAKASRQGRASHLRLHGTSFYQTIALVRHTDQTVADRRVHSRRAIIDSSALKHQRKQSCTSGNDNSTYGVAISNNANPDQPSGPDTIDTNKPVNMSQLLSIQNCMMEDVVSDLSGTGLNHINNSYNSLLNHDDTMNVFDFEDSLTTKNNISDRCSQNENMRSDLVGSLLSTDAGFVPRLFHDHCPSCCCGSTGSSTKASTVDSDSSIEERFDFVVESVQNAGFKDIDDMVLAYYTASFNEESDIFHEQRMSRKRGLPAMLSRLRGSTAAWQEYEREAYQAEILNNAESILVGECRRLFTSPAFKERLADLQSGAILSSPRSPSSSSSYESRISSGTGNTGASCCFAPSLSHSKTWLLEELPNVWKLVSALSGCRAGSQPVATVLLTLCFADHLQAEQLRMLL